MQTAPSSGDNIVLDHQEYIAKLLTVQVLMLNLIHYI